MAIQNVQIAANTYIAYLCYRPSDTPVCIHCVTSQVIVTCDNSPRRHLLLVADTVDMCITN